jgi:hypothetical protein
MEPLSKVNLHIHRLNSYHFFGGEDLKSSLLALLKLLTAVTLLSNRNGKDGEGKWEGWSTGTQTGRGSSRGNPFGNQAVQTHQLCPCGLVTSVLTHSGHSSIMFQKTCLIF